jgi:hypothetical protein
MSNRCFTSAQRLWIQNDMKEWCGKDFLSSYQQRLTLVDVAYQLIDYFYKCLFNKRIPLKKERSSLLLPVING